MLSGRLQDSLEFMNQDSKALRPDQNTVVSGFLGSIGNLYTQRASFISWMRKEFIYTFVVGAFLVFMEIQVLWKGYPMRKL